MVDTHAERGNFAADLLISDALSVEFGSFSADVLRKTKLCLIDFLSCALEARNLDWSRQARSVVETGGRFALVGNGYTTTAGEAGFVNAVAGHGLVREDMHAGSISHLGVVVWPALLAYLGRTGLDGQAFLRSAIIGYEVGARLGREVMTAELARLFRPTGLVGAPAVTLALAGACRASATEALNAFSLAVNAVSGLNQWPHTGGSEMYFHPGFAVRNGILAFDLARQGAVSSASILEGEAGYFAAYARRLLEHKIRAFDSNEPEIMAVFNKEVPACNFAQTPCQAALRAGQRVPAGGVIEQVEVYVTNAAERYPGCNAKGPFERALQAKMSIYFGVAATLVLNQIAEDNYARVNDPEIAGMIARTNLIVDPVLTAQFPARQGARVRLLLADGTALEEALDDVVPAGPELIVERFMNNASLAWGDAHATRVAEMILSLEEHADIGVLNTLLAAEASGSMKREGQ